MQVHAYRALRGRYPAWRPRKEAIGVYNCFGHVWASRRTSIYNEGKEAQTILRDDAYRPLAQGVSPRIGDLAVYWNEPKTEVVHVGICVDPNLEAELQVPLVLSKWGDHFGEDVHSAYDVTEDLKPLNLEWWTDR